MKLSLWRQQQVERSVAPNAYMPVRIDLRLALPGGIDTDWGYRSGHPGAGPAAPEGDTGFLLTQ